MVPVDIQFVTGVASIDGPGLIPSISFLAPAFLWNSPQVVQFNAPPLAQALTITAIITNSNAWQYQFIPVTTQVLGYLTVPTPPQWMYTNQLLSSQLVTLVGFPFGSDVSLLYGSSYTAAVNITTGFNNNGSLIELSQPQSQFYQAAIPSPISWAALTSSLVASFSFNAPSLLPYPARATCSVSVSFSYWFLPTALWCNYLHVQCEWSEC